MLRFLGKIGKGYATWTGIAAVILGTLGKTDAAAALPGAVEGIAGAVQGVGALLFTFGVGRKGGATIKN